MSPGSACVVDASVATKWLLTDEDDAAAALMVLSDFVNGKLELYVPEQVFAEVASAVTVASTLRRGRIAPDDARSALATFVALPLHATASRDLAPAAFDLAHQHDCALYDMLYLALAQRLRIPLLNADRKLQDRIGHLPDVLWIADYRPAQERESG